MTDIVYNKNGIPFDIDEIATDLNGKADVDLSNISASASAKNGIISWALPDYTNAIDLGLSTSWKTYTCPQIGYIDFYIVGFTTGGGGVEINGKKIQFANSVSSGYIQSCCGQFMVNSGDVIRYVGTYSNPTAYGTQYIEFVPCKEAS